MLPFAAGIYKTHKGDEKLPLFVNQQLFRWSAKEICIY